MISFIEFYVWYQNLRTNSPPVFAEHLAVQTLGHALGRNSINEIQPRAVHHNTYLNLLGKSGKSRKTTAQEDIMKPLYPTNYVGPAHFSPEGLLRALGEQSQLICPLGEFSSFLRGIRKGSYMETFKEVANELFTCPPEFEKSLGNQDRSYYVKEPYLSINTTCTMEEFKDNIDLTMLHGGFLPRWINIYAMPDYRKRGPLPEGVDRIENHLKDIIHRLYVECEKKPLKFTMADDAYDTYDKICQDLEENDKWQDVQGYVARMQNYIIAYADILRVSDFIGEKVLRLEELMKLTKLIKLIQLMKTDMNLNAIKGINYINSINSIDSNLIKRAWEMLKPHLEYVHNLISDIEEDRFVSKVIHAFQVNNTKILTWSKCLQYSHLNARDFGTAVETLILREQMIKTSKNNINYLEYNGAV